ncbi:MAG: DUF6491 family protein [Hyphomonadaceae bacterium]
MLRTITFIAAATILTACTTPAVSTASYAGSDRDCFRALDVRGYSVLDDGRIGVRVSPQRQYILTISPQDAQNLDWTHAISVRSVTSFICVGAPSGVQLVGGDPALPYQVRSIERAPTDMADAGS